MRRRVLAMPSGQPRHDLPRTPPESAKAGLAGLAGLRFRWCVLAIAKERAQFLARVSQLARLGFARITKTAEARAKTMKQSYMA